MYCTCMYINVETNFWAHFRDDAATSPGCVVLRNTTYNAITAGYAENDTPKILPFSCIVILVL